MIKWFLAPPVLALLSVVLMRGLSAPQSPETAVHAAPTEGEVSDVPSVETSPYMQFARLTFDEGVRPIINARAVTLFQRAQSEPDAIAWIDGHCRQTAGDIAFQEKTLGVVTGDATQFAEFLNRSAELAACSLAQHWLSNGGVALDAGSVNPAIILKQYGEVYKSDNK